RDDRVRQRRPVRAAAYRPGDLAADEAQRLRLRGRGRRLPGGRLARPGDAGRGRGPAIRVVRLASAVVAYEFKLPDLSEGLTEGEIARWLVAEGDEIAEDQPLVEIQTDKTTVEIPSPAAGPVAKILVAEGEVVPVGTVLVVIGDGAVASDHVSEGPVRGLSPDMSRPASAEGRTQATPLVRKIAAELGVDLATVAGTGPGGRITEDD